MVETASHPLYPHGGAAESTTIHRQAKNIELCRTKRRGVQLRLKQLQKEKNLADSKLENDPQALELLIEENKLSVILLELLGAHLSPADVPTPQQSSPSATTGSKNTPPSVPPADAAIGEASGSKPFNHTAWHGDNAVAVDQTSGSNVNWTPNTSGQPSFQNSISGATNASLHLTPEASAARASGYHGQDSIHLSGSTEPARSPKGILANSNDLSDPSPGSHFNHVPGQGPDSGWAYHGVDFEGYRSLHHVTYSVPLRQAHGSYHPTADFVNVSRHTNLDRADPLANSSTSTALTEHPTARIGVSRPRTLMPRSAIHGHYNAGSSLHSSASKITPAGKRLLQHKVKSQEHRPKRKRSKFENETLRKETANKRLLGACLKCKNDKNRCATNPNDPEGPCLGCLQLPSYSTGDMCIRWKIARLSLIRDQSAPWPDWTTRYNHMEAIDITTWASQDVKKLQLSHGMPGASYTLHVKRFAPVASDMLCETWFDSSIGAFKQHPIEPYAVCNMHQLHQEMQRYVDQNVARFIRGVLGNSDRYLWGTFFAAFKRSQNERVRERERWLLLDALRLWVTSRISSMPEEVCGDEKVATRVNDPSSPYDGTYLVPPVIYAQEETVLLTKIQRPLQQRVLAELDALMKGKMKENWFTIYLTLFVLLHSCTLTMKRDAEFAKQMNLSTQYANPDPIADNRAGVLELVKQFHVDKGSVPFDMALDPSRMHEVIEAAHLTDQEAGLVQETAKWAFNKGYMFPQAQRDQTHHNEYHLISQLYTQRWNTPGLS